VATTVVLMGVAGVGKTSVMRALAARLHARTQEGDELHPPANVEKMASGVPLTDDDRRPWLDAIARWIGGQERAGNDAIVTCSALKRAYRDRLRNGHPSVWFAHLVAPRDVLAARMTTRHGHFMPEALLDSQLAALEPLEPDEPGATFPTTASPDQVAEAIAARLRSVDAS
jgi:gluconokinase